MDRSDWIKALRSGEYPQAYGHLKDNKGFCCLGVAASLTEELKEVDEWEVGLRNCTKTKQTFGIDYIGRLKQHVWINKTTEAISTDFDVLVNVGDWTMYDSLVEINDNGFDFKFIANFIEEYGDLLVNE